MEVLFDSLSALEFRRCLPDAGIVRESFSKTSVSWSAIISCFSPGDRERRGKSARIPKFKTGLSVQFLSIEKV